VDEEYDSDFGEEHYDDESVGERSFLVRKALYQSLISLLFLEDIPEQNVSTDELPQQASAHRPLTLSISPSVQLSTSSGNNTQHQRSSVFAAVAPTLSLGTPSESSYPDLSGGSPSSKQHKKLNLQIAPELSDLVRYELSSCAFFCLLKNAEPSMSFAALPR